MTQEYEPLIHAHHQHRLALVYIRMARTPDTSREWLQYQHQCSQEEWPHRWGWTSDRVLVSDEDLGRCDVATDRPGFQKLRNMIAQGRVGLVLVSDLGRLSRSNVTLLAFLELCRRHGTLVAANGHLIDLTHPPGNYSERLYDLVAAFHRNLTSLFKELDALVDELD